ncbi:hypothetical protein M947_09160 [Sulfurimonas hongkongensis]|uniref:BPL/LPL catalytic domain-containing protein n=1 Tax=Sulfurimonas hongkongensis TaxID=1172190 RepID=T0JBI2_9BACT|nr:biotin--[acetyl-CoA-carboxylase] ligase [Sulfurimonas hongkongensis]EQB35441.1 hypothetical protein M947_09160 [Sulfurimonas hongkongensis]
MKILYLKEIDSTQKFLKKLIRGKEVKAPFAVVSDTQSAGVGSRNNAWNSQKGNLFLSFAIELDELPKDLKLESASIYFSYILKTLLYEEGSCVWIKWPNDFYVDDKKIGGMITNLEANTLICGLGLNLVMAPDGFAKLDIKVDKKEVLKKYFTKIEEKISWKQVFSKYELEFYKNKNFFTHNQNIKIPLEGVKLQQDGSIINNGKRIYSTR